MQPNHPKSNHSWMSAFDYIAHRLPAAPFDVLIAWAVLSNPPSMYCLLLTDGAAARFIAVNGGISLGLTVCILWRSWHQRSDRVKQLLYLLGPIALGTWLLCQLLPNLAMSIAILASFIYLGITIVYGAETWPKFNQRLRYIYTRKSGSTSAERTLPNGLAGIHCLLFLILAIAGAAVTCCAITW